MMHCLTTVGGLVSVGVYARRKFSWNLKVLRPSVVFLRPNAKPPTERLTQKKSIKKRLTQIRMSSTFIIMFLILCNLRTNFIVANIKTYHE